MHSLNLIGKNHTLKNGGLKMKNQSKIHKQCFACPCMLQILESFIKGESVLVQTDRAYPLNSIKIWHHNDFMVHLMGLHHCK